MIDGEMVVAILTGHDLKSKNGKTGAMPQVWIFRADRHPVEAMRDGSDHSVCGNCPHRPKRLGPTALQKDSRSCYVKTMNMGVMYKKYANGGYESPSLSDIKEILSGKHVRIGAYGDPAAIPLEVWDTILADCESTGYTHQWRNCDNGYSKYCMASCDNVTDVIDATKEGYRTFFVQTPASEFVRTVGNIKLSHCPASKEMGRVTNCDNCMACSGIRSGRKSNITILMH